MKKWMMAGMMMAALSMAGCNQADEADNAQGADKKDGENHKTEEVATKLKEKEVKEQPKTEKALYENEQDVVLSTWLSWGEPARHTLIKDILSKHPTIVVDEAEAYDSLMESLDGVDPDVLTIFALLETSYDTGISWDNEAPKIELVAPEYDIPVSEFYNLTPFNQQAYLDNVFSLNPDLTIALFDLQDLLNSEVVKASVEDTMMTIDCIELALENY